LRVIGLTSATIHKIQNTLKILDPITLPIAISDCHLRAALMLVTSSGNDVPTDKIVRPITFSDRPIMVARLTACLTAKSPQKISAASHQIIYTQVFQFSNNSGASHSSGSDVP